MCKVWWCIELKPGWVYSRGETILNPARQLIDELNATGAVLVGRRTAEWWLMSAGGLQSQ